VRSVFSRLRDSGGLFAKYGPGTAEEARADGTRVRVHFHKPISTRRAHRFARAIADGAPVPPNARVTITEHPPAYKVPGRFDGLEWREISGCPIGENPGGSEEQYFVQVNGKPMVGTYRGDWLGTLAWFDDNGRKIKPERYAVMPPARG
jgi:hypothetical protein